MNGVPPALWSDTWRGVDLRVFATGDDSPLSLHAAAAVLCENEHARAARFHFASDRDRWMRCRALLRLALGERLGMPAANVRFHIQENGKPALDSKPEQGSALQFNLSHSGPLMALALGSGPVGVDIECWTPVLPAGEVSAHAFRPEEHEAIVLHSEPLRYFLELWTAKEAVMKCTGQGLSLPPPAVIVSPAGNLAVIEGARGAFQLRSMTHPGMWVLTAAQPACQPALHDEARSALIPEVRSPTVTPL